MFTPDLYFCRMRFGFALFLFSFSWMAHSQILPNMGGQRAGVSTLGFLKNDISPTAIAMSGAATALEGSAFSSGINPAGLASLDAQNFALSHIYTGAGFAQSFLSSSHKLKNEHTFSVSLNSLYTPSMKVRTEFHPDGNGTYFSVNNSALGLSYAANLTNMFSVGITLNYVYESIAEYKNHTATADIGFLYKTDLKDLRFAVMVQNFGGNSSLTGSEYPVAFNREDIDLSDYTVPTVFKMGFSFVPWKNDVRKWLFSAELNHPNDNSENLRFGVQYSYRELLDVMGGFKLSVKGQSWPTLGMNFRTKSLGYPVKIGYAVMPTNAMGTWHSIGFSAALKKQSR